MEEAGEGSTPRMPPFPSGHWQTCPLPALLQLQLPGPVTLILVPSTPWSHRADVTRAILSVGKTGSGDVGTPAAGWAKVSGRLPQKQHRGSRGPGLQALLCFLRPLASVTNNLPGSSSHGPCRYCSDGSAMSMNSSPPAFRCTDGWLSGVFLCCAQDSL